MVGKNYQILIVALAVLITACNKEPVTEPGGNTNLPPVSTPGDRSIYVACEGSFGNGNASMSVLNISSDANYENVYYNVNGELLGDVFQSITKVDDKLFLCINNSDKVVVLSASDRKLIKTINISKPRYVLVVGDDKAYVTSQYSNDVYVLNTNTLSVTGKIEMSYQNPEGMIRLGEMAYVCCWDTACNMLYSIDIAKDQVVDSYTLAGYAPHDIVSDKNDDIWVLSGNVNKNKQASLTSFNANSFPVVKSFNFTDNKDPIKLRVNSSGDMLYYIGVDYLGGNAYNGVFKMNVDDAQLPNTPFIPAQQLQYFWGLGIDPNTNDIFVGDPKGFVQKGAVMIYSANGTLKKTYETGIGPGYFYFDE